MTSGLSPLSGPGSSVQPHSDSSVKGKRNPREAILDGKLIDQLIARVRCEDGAGAIDEPIATRTRSCLRSRQSKTPFQQHTTPYLVINKTQKVSQQTSSVRVPGLIPCLV